ncbi:methylated-DNA--[protein]-cysteine S-methyltransferase [Caproiciproducens sp. CPB-2]|uniref:methylated-DNA--[protein]-cysteine S-methyltransferase n=1 Tax=Caproiciproducens sp. CPB-2 TaxID=3030017 RepID=UPI0023DACEBB|nr:methylated-DNA--[protein]-cysteine S-methyltransferase [Caproiciproducens sp. CPB-2]MDF1493176.1 methylated-DNA--[protein]-cysteine S-methyltransferase [Caproiciproducens sp. CPB-2]
MKDTAKISTPLGLVLITAANDTITGLSFTDDPPETAVTPKTPLLKEAERQLSEYFSGIRKAFDLPLRAEGTEFQKTVWAALRSIPYGETRSYGQVAKSIGRPSASRAVGMANNKNPILILTPCHRVVGSDGGLVGYAGGLERKEQLLKLERTHANR